MKQTLKMTTFLVPVQLKKEFKRVTEELGYPKVTDAYLDYMRLLCYSKSVDCAMFKQALIDLHKEGKI